MGARGRRRSRRRRMRIEYWWKVRKKETTRKTKV
jgi:hypothetical protein